MIHYSVQLIISPKLKDCDIQDSFFLIIICGNPHIMQSHYVLTMEQLQQEMCDHVLGHVFGVTHGVNMPDFSLSFFQVMGWPDFMHGTVPPHRVAVYARPVPCLNDPQRPFWLRIPDESVLPRPSEPKQMNEPGWFPCVIQRNLDPETGQANHVLYYDRRMYRPRTQWMLPGYVFQLTTDGLAPNYCQKQQP